MQAVEHRRGRQGNPDASRCLRRPQPASSPEGQDGGGGCASAVNAPRGSCVRRGCVGSDQPPRVARRRAPGSNRCVCSSADRGRSGCTAGPGQSTGRTGTSGRNRPCAPRGLPKPKVLDGRVPASHTPAAPPYSARCRARHGRPAAKRWTAAAPDYFGIVASCTTRGSPSVHRRGAQRPDPDGVDDPPGPIHHDMLRPPPGGSTACLRLHGRPPGGHAGEELTDAPVPSSNHRVKHPGMQIRVLTAE